MTVYNFFSGFLFIYLFIYFVLFVFILFIYLLLERGETREKERKKNINVWLPLTRPPPQGSWPATQASALTGNRICGPLVTGLCSVHWAKPAKARLYITWLAVYKSGKHCTKHIYLEEQKVFSESRRYREQEASLNYGIPNEHSMIWNGKKFVVTGAE